MKLVEPKRYVTLKASGRLPSAKGLALIIVRMLQREDYKTEELVRLIKSDPVIAGEILKFSNVASIGHSRPIISLSQAVTTLGTRQLRAIVIAFSVINNNRTGNCSQFDYEKFWSRSLATAISAQSLAAYAQINAEENFTAGLLCTLGELALASLFPKRYGEIISTSSKQYWCELEQESFGNDHRELNSSLLFEWGLPMVLVTAIYYCEDPDKTNYQDESRIQRIALSLNAALTLADICVADESERLAMLPELYAKAARLRISEEVMNLMAQKIIDNWQEWGKQLKIQTREVTTFA